MNDSKPASHLPVHHYELHQSGHWGSTPLGKFKKIAHSSKDHADLEIMSNHPVKRMANGDTKGWRYSHTTSAEVAADQNRTLRLLPTVEASATGKAWFDSLSHEQREGYLKEHPHSRYAQRAALGASPLAPVAKGKDAEWHSEQQAKHEKLAKDHGIMAERHQHQSSFEKSQREGADARRPKEYDGTKKSATEHHAYHEAKAIAHDDKLKHHALSEGYKGHLNDKHDWAHPDLIHHVKSLPSNHEAHGELLGQTVHRKLTDHFDKLAHAHAKREEAAAK